MFKNRKIILAGIFMAAVMLFTIPAFAGSSGSQTGYVTAPSLNDRSGPSTAYPRLGSFKQGQAITILGQTNGWDKVYYNGQTAYVSGNYVSTGSKSSGTSSSSSSYNNSGSSYSSSSAGSSRSGSKLTRSAGTVQGPSGKETYYNLNMSGVVNIMRNLGYSGSYWVRSDGCKMFGNYIMVAANLKVHPRGSIVQTSLGAGIVCDTGGFASSNPYQIDIATTW